MEETFKDISYLRARDPSIISWNRHGLGVVKVNLEVERLQDLTELKEEAENFLHVYLRIKADEAIGNLYEVSDNTLISYMSESLSKCRGVKNELVGKKYSFSKIFGIQSQQKEIFNHIVKPKILGLINGSNCTLLTYGVSGAGKTFTIVGTPSEPGLIPRALEYLFRTLPELPKRSVIKPLPNGSIVRLKEQEMQSEELARFNLLEAPISTVDRAQHISTYRAMQERLSKDPGAILEEVIGVSLGVWVSFAEIYNEQIYDLLLAKPALGQQRPILRLASENDLTYIKNLTCIGVRSGLEAYQILQYGLHHLKYAATKLNAHSSRSHSIFTIKLAQASDTEEGVHVSYFNFCDLAGAERSKKTMNVGDRLRESNNINTSLLVLGKCIAGVRNGQKTQLIPFRESKLTKLFQRALSGQEDISMVVNINCSPVTFEESQHVLNFSAIAKDIIINKIPKPVKPVKQRQMKENLDEQDVQIQLLEAKKAQLNMNLIVQDIENEENLKLQIQTLESGYEELERDTIAMYKDRIRKAKVKCEREFQSAKASLEMEHRKKLKKLPKPAKRIRIESSTSNDSIDRRKIEFEKKKDLLKELEECTSTEKSLQKEINILRFEEQLIIKEEEDLDIKINDCCESIEQLNAVAHNNKENCNIVTEKNAVLNTELEDFASKYNSLDGENQSVLNSIREQLKEIATLKNKIEVLEERIR